MKKLIVLTALLASAVLIACSTPTESYDPKKDYDKFDREVFCYGKVFMPPSSSGSPAGGTVDVWCGTCGESVGLLKDIAIIEEDGYYEVKAVNALKHAGHSGDVCGRYLDYFVWVEYEAFPVSPFELDLHLEAP